MNIKQKVLVACDIAGISMTELGRRLGMSQQSMTNRLKTGKFTQEELEKMGEALGCTYKSGFYFPDGNKVEQSYMMQDYFLNFYHNEIIKKTIKKC